MAELQAELDEARAKEAAAEAGGVPGAGLAAGDDVPEAGDVPGAGRAAGDDVPEAGDEPEAEGVSGAGARAQVTLRKAERPEQKPMLIVAPELKRDTPLCHRCRKPVEVFKSQLLATKSQGSWRCNLCNSKGTQLSRVFGAWPPVSFKHLSPEAQESFWEAAKQCKDATKLEEIFINHLVKSRIEQEVAKSGGEYLPLSVYHARGFDTEAIRTTCRDTEQHEVLGTCYRVSIKSVFSKSHRTNGRKGIAGMERSVEDAFGGEEGEQGEEAEAQQQWELFLVIGEEEEEWEKLQEQRRRERKEGGEHEQNTGF